MPGPKDFYNRNAQSFFTETIGVDLTPIYQRFLAHLSKNASILDAGCGSGRDSRYFLSLGYKVTAIDQSEELCKLATIHTGIEVQNRKFEDIAEVEVYSGIWACASLLHVPKNDLPSIFKKLEIALRPKGVLYASFKLGDFEGTRGDRYFTDLTLDSVKDLVSHTNLKIVEDWITDDLRPDRAGQQWLNLLLRKS